MRTSTSAAKTGVRPIPAGFLIRLCVMSAGLLLLVHSAAGQGTQAPSPDAVVATVDGVPITHEEVLARGALTVVPYKQLRWAPDVVARHFLYALIAERLLADEARKRGWAAEAGFTRSERIAEEAFARDKLYRDAVRSSVRITDTDVRERFERRAREREYQFIVSESEAEIRALASVVAAGVPFDTLLAARQEDAPPDSMGARSTVLDASVDTLLERLVPGAVSDPVRLKDGWYIIRRVDLRTELSSEDAFMRRAPALRAELRREREAEAAVAFMRDLWRGREVRLEDRPMRVIGQRLLDAVRAQARADTSESLSPTPDVYDALRLDPGWNVSGAFARCDGDSLSILDAIDRLEALGVRVSRDDRTAFPAAYQRAVRTVLDRWLLSREAFRRGLQHSDEVRRDIELWRRAGYAQTVPDVLVEQYLADEDSLWAFVCSRPELAARLPELRLFEVHASGRHAMDTAAALLRLGRDTASLAAMYPDTPAGRDRLTGGMWIRADAVPELGRAAMGLAVGEGSGPIPSAGGWSVVRLLDRRNAGSAALSTMADLREAALGEHGGALRTRATHAAVVRLARNARIVINEAVLEGVRLSTTQMFTVRWLGFGGRIPAMPGVLPLHEAVLEGLSTRSTVHP